MIGQSDSESTQEMWMLTEASGIHNYLQLLIEAVSFHKLLSTDEI